jgi:predicted nuclease with TOPRIM domain
MDTIKNARLLNKENYVNEIEKIHARIDELNDKLDEVDDDDEHVNQVKLDLYPEQIEALQKRAENLEKRFLKEDERFEDILSELKKTETTEYNLEYLKSEPDTRQELDSIIRSITQILVNMNESKK